MILAPDMDDFATTCRSNRGAELGRALSAKQTPTRKSAGSAEPQDDTRRYNTMEKNLPWTKNRKTTIALFGAGFKRLSGKSEMDARHLPTVPKGCRYKSDEADGNAEI